MLRTRIAVLACAVSLFAAPALRAQQLMVNGGFESGNFFGWTTAIHGDPACANAYQVSAIAAASGNFGLSSGLPKPGCIFNSNTIVSQFINTTPGQQYNLSYVVQQQPGFPRTNCPNVSLGCGNFFGVRLKSHIDPQTTFITPAGVFDFSPVFGSFPFSNSFVALTATTEVEIEMWAQRDFWYVDDVSVQAVTLTPEPSTWALMAAGLSALVIARRRRSSRAS